MSHGILADDEKSTNPPNLHIHQLDIPGYEKVIEAIDKENNLHCFIAIDNLTLGPSLGGTRIFPYSTPEEALEDVLRLAKGMTKKAAIAEVGFGGAKSVIIADPRKDKTPKLLHAFGRVVDSLKGDYIAAEDVGSSPRDMEIIHEETPYVSALTQRGSSGDPSPFTAWGVFRGIEATAQHIWGSPSLKGKRIAVQGLGHVGSKLVEHLFWSGADLILTDVDKEQMERCAYYYSAETATPDTIHQQECDIFTPCAMGGVINPITIPELRCKAIAGAANNQLLDEESDSKLLQERKILYAPDYIINSGGLINVSMEYEPEGYCAKKSRNKVDNLYHILLNIFNRCDREGKTTLEIAEDLWHYNIKFGIGKRHEPIKFIPKPK